LLLGEKIDLYDYDSRDSVDESDTAEKYSKLLQEHVDRFEVVEKVMSGLNDTMVAFHGKVGGDIKKIEALFVDMAPEPQKGKPMPPGTDNICCFLLIAI
jgi:hypothetical protein